MKSLNFEDSLTNEQQTKASQWNVQNTFSITLTKTIF